MIEDEPGLVLGVGDRLKAEGYQFFSETDDRSGLQRVSEEAFDLVLLDIMLPGIQGFDFLRGLRDKKKSLPVIMLTAKSQIPDKVSGLRLGADDYVTKPFDIDELIARIETLLRRAAVPVSSIVPATGNPQVDISFGPFVYDQHNSQIFKNGTPMELSFQEHQILKVFVNNEGQVLEELNEV